jgi:hypothetical protein
MSLRFCATRASDGILVKVWEATIDPEPPVDFLLTGHSIEAKRSFK